MSEIEIILADLKRQREALNRIADEAVGRREDRDEALRRIERLRILALRAGRPVEDDEIEP